MQRLLILAAAGEAAMGLALLVHPPVVVRLLFGAEIVGAGIVMSRIAGIALIALGIACWPGRATAALGGMLAYSLLTTLYLAYLGFGGEWTGKLLWLAVAVHAVLTVLLARAWLKDRPHPGTQTDDQTGRPG
jgi:membrane protein implicated in regulation of membrane protease activity